MDKFKESLFDHIVFIYGQAQAESIYQRILLKVDQFQTQHPDLAESDAQERVNESDAILITYGDMVQTQGQHPIHTLTDFLSKHLGDLVSTVHILPFYPYSSDDGFSVIDYKQVNPALGNWEDVTRLGKNFRLMFDAVVNHISAESSWFQGFLRGEPDYEDYFTVVEPGTDLSQVFRPRATPVLTSFETPTGEKLVWTTFSTDQIDLNYANPEVLFEVIDTLFWYISNGAEFIRLDAIAFIWKEAGTNCIHLPQAHRLIQLIRTLLDITAPMVSIITETNVPHQENISYFGDGANEAQMVYNFTLPPLTLHTFYTGNAEMLTQWAQTLVLPSEKVTFFNFLASHDGIGLMPVRGILPESMITAMAERVKALGGYVSYKNNPDGSQTPYEMNINYLDALGDPSHLHEDTALVAQRFLATQAIMLSIRGVPGIYFHSLFGSQNWSEGVEQTGRYRTINRQKLQREVLIQELSDPDGLRHQVLKGYRQLLQARKNTPAFHPNGGQHILSIHPAIFGLLRTSPGVESRVLCLHNVTDRAIELEIDLRAITGGQVDALCDLISGQVFAPPTMNFSLIVQPYQVYWLEIQ